MRISDWSSDVCFSDLISYFSQVVVAIFRITVLATLSPFMMFGFGFGWGRPMAYAGIRTMLSAFMVLFGATLALGIMLYGVTRLGITKSLTPDELRDLASLSNETFLLVLALGRSEEHTSELQSLMRISYA